MKKVLSAFFAVFLSITGGYCENTSYVDTNLSSNDSMNSVISIRAIYEGLSINECSSLQSDAKREIARLIGSHILQGENITLDYFLSICLVEINERDYKEDISGKTNKCMGCTIDIAKKHNELIQEQYNNTVFTSEEEYNKALKIKGYCNKHSVIDAPAYAAFKLECEKDCKRMAIQNACVLKGYIHNTLTSSVECNCFHDYYHLDFVPTWKDYKKLYKIK